MVYSATRPADAVSFGLRIALSETDLDFRPDDQAAANAGKAEETDAARNAGGIAVSRLPIRMLRQGAGSA